MYICCLFCLKSLCIFVCGYIKLQSWWRIVTDDYDTFFGSLEFRAYTFSLILRNSIQLHFTFKSISVYNFLYLKVVWVLQNTHDMDCVNDINLWRSKHVCQISFTTSSVRITQTEPTKLWKRQKPHNFFFHYSDN